MAKHEGTEGRVDLATADAEQLKRIEGIDAARAELILRHRSRHGPFRTWDDFEAVAGIGPALVEKAKESAFLGGDGAAGGKRRGKRERGASGRVEAAGGDGVRTEAPVETPIEVAVSPTELVTALARLDAEAALAYDAAAEACGDAEVARHLRQFAGDHRRHVDELNRVLEREEEPTVSAPEHEPVLAGIMKVAAPLGLEVIVVALLGNEQLTNLSYDGALAYEWDGEDEAMLERFAADEQRHLAWLARMHDEIAGHAGQPEPPELSE